ncbi:response regulator receiver protein [Anaerovibrio sp. JC8]|uniref:LytR/AlgR family response regulator transcription factor n=1 Tax=Anaerovibrio sp. JC8 TaxID=1240085 RepID=UPI000A0D9519|nr:LytTR family DNA-binding domain-containing protein [Anaerovibrio sp. JC8]ORT98922.1 response regulator receiver protein [Anaerovibrio sp. JC8]
MDIAIIDDDDLDREIVLNYCQNFIHQHYPQEEPHINIVTLSSGEELLEKYDKGAFDLVILDIYMTGITGLETAKRIREYDSEVSIIFLTSSDEYILEGYRVFAVGYFIKPLAEHEEEFANTFDFIFPKLLQKQGGISLKVNGAPVDISYSDIIYIDVFDSHNINFHLVNGVLVSSMSYGEICDILMKDERFLECHHRMILNMDYVEDMESEAFRMTDGSQLPISRRKRQDVKVAYMNHIISK